MPELSIKTVKAINTRPDTLKNAKITYIATREGFNPLKFSGWTLTLRAQEAHYNIKIISVKKRIPKSASWRLESIQKANDPVYSVIMRKTYLQNTRKLLSEYLFLHYDFKNPW